METKQQLVSVIMPCYNGEKFIGKAIESVINQTYQNWELIIVDDGSTDNSKKIIDHYLSDRRIIYIRHIRNKGIPVTRNTGINASHGDFIALLDQDDKWVPNKLDLQIDRFYISKPEIGLVFGNINRIDSYGNIIHRAKNIKINFETINQRNLIRHLFLNCFIPSITVMIKRKCIKEVGAFDEDILWGGDDYDLWLRIISKFEITYINQVLAIRREHGNNYSTVEKSVKGNILLIKKILKKYPFIKNLINIKKARLFYCLGRYEHKRANFSEARRLYIKALLYYPTINWKIYLVYTFAILKINFDYRKIVNFFK